MPTPFANCPPNPGSYDGFNNIVGLVNVFLKRVGFLVIGRFVPLPKTVLAALHYERYFSCADRRRQGT